MRKKIFSIITFIIMILPFYVNADTGNITISCNPSAIKAGNTTECTINGKTDNEITSIDNAIKTLEAINIYNEYKLGLLDEEKVKFIEKQLDIFDIL